MPIPKTKDIGKIIRFLNKEHPNMPRKQKIAIALKVRKNYGKKKHRRRK